MTTTPSRWRGRWAALFSIRTYLILWFSQSVSILGSAMTGYTVSLFVFEQTGQATSLVWLGLARLLPGILIHLLAGDWVDRFPRKRLMLLGDGMTGLMTLSLLALLLTDNLELWHLYAINLISSPFEALQRLAWEASSSLLVPSRHYVRISGLSWFTLYGTNITATAFGTALYIAFGLHAVVLADLATLFFAVVVLAFQAIPQPEVSEQQKQEHRQPILQRVLFGFRYILARPALTGLLLVFALFYFFHDITGGLYIPLLLARTGGDEVALAKVIATAGVAGMCSALLVSAFGGPKRRMATFLAGTFGAAIAKLFFPLGRTVATWVPLQFFSSINFPLKDSAYSALWRVKVHPAEQGRVFAASYLFSQLAGVLGYWLSGPLGDRVFEPALQGPTIWQGLVGQGPGAGFALLFFFSALGMLATGLLGLFWPGLRTLEADLPDHGAALPESTAAD